MKLPKIIKKEFFSKIVLVQYSILSNTYKKGFCEKGRKDHIFISFRMFPFHGNIIFSELSFKRKCKKAASFRKCVFLRKYEIFVYDSRIWCRIVTKTSDFLLVFKSTFRWRYLREKMKFSVVLQRKQAVGQLFVEDVFIFRIISFRIRFSPLW